MSHDTVGRDANDSHEAAQAANTEGTSKNMGRNESAQSDSEAGNAGKDQYCEGSVMFYGMEEIPCRIFVRCMVLPVCLPVFPYFFHEKKCSLHMKRKEKKKMQFAYEAKGEKDEFSNNLGYGLPDGRIFRRCTGTLLSWCICMGNAALRRCFMQERGRYLSASFTNRVPRRTSDQRTRNRGAEKCPGPDFQGAGRKEVFSRRPAFLRSVRSGYKAGSGRPERRRYRR